MALPFGQVNFLAVVVGVVINMALGTLWYSRVLFGNLWLRLMGKSSDEVANPGPAFALAIVAAFIGATTLALLIATMGSSSAVEGIMAGLLVGVGFIATTTITSSIYEGKHLGIWGIFASYQIVAYAIIGAVLAVWN